MEYPNGKISSDQIATTNPIQAATQRMRRASKRIESCVYALRSVVSSLSHVRAVQRQQWQQHTRRYSTLSHIRQMSMCCHMFVSLQFVCAVTTLRTAHTWNLQRYPYRLVFIGTVWFVSTLQCGVFQKIHSQFIKSNTIQMQCMRFENGFSDFKKPKASLNTLRNHTPSMLPMV